MANVSADGELRIMLHLSSDSDCTCTKSVGTDLTMLDIGNLEDLQTENKQLRKLIASLEAKLQLKEEKELHKEDEDCGDHFTVQELKDEPDLLAILKTEPNPKEITPYGHTHGGQCDLQQAGNEPRLHPAGQTGLTTAAMQDTMCESDCQSMSQTLEDVSGLTGACKTEQDLLEIPYPVCKDEYQQIPLDPCAVKLEHTRRVQEPITKEKKLVNPERYSLSRALELLELISGDNSEVEDLSDIDDLVGDTEYQPPQQEASSSEEDGSGCDDSIPQPSHLTRGRKRHRDEYERYWSDRDIARSCTTRCHSQTQQEQDDISNNVPVETTSGPSHQEQSKEGRGMQWRASPPTPNQVQFEHEEETVQNRENWTPLDYIEQYIDKDLMKMIADCSNASSLARNEAPLNTSTDEMYHFFGACILMSCIPYPAIRMYWSKTLKFPAITEKFTRDRFFRLRRSLKVLIDDDVPEDLRERDKFWKVRPFLNRILKGCKSQARPQCISIDEQIIPFTGTCPWRQYLPMKLNPVGMKNFVCATPEGIVLDFEIYQGVDALLGHVEEPGDLGLEILVMDRLSQTLHPNTNIYCDRFFTSIKVMEHMMKKQMYVTGTVMKNRVAAAVQKLPTDKRMKKEGRGSSAQVTTEDGKICVVKWYDNKPVLMMSSVHAREPEDNCQRWDKKLKQYVTISRPNIIREYNSKMGGVGLASRIISFYRMSGRTKKWTLRMLMYFADLALANSWLLYRKDLTVCGTPKKNIMQYLEFRMEVAMTFLAEHANDSSDVSEQDDPDVLVQGKKRPAKAVPHVSFRRRANAHLPEMVNMKNAARCRAKGCSGKTRVRCGTCKVFLCLQGDRNCYTAFHT
ncbi:piggyBac transposable element-derived protein 3 isoform X2 [Brachyhypopomus gauderio]|uniref:piggyBac transposable element-derived protein 3 isoform X2 n=1 Tax=Brachyhypopomus gauderio TaxID=698409 RepID=UPI004041A02F